MSFKIYIQIYVWKKEKNGNGNFKQIWLKIVTIFHKQKRSFSNMIFFLFWSYFFQKHKREGVKRKKMDEYWLDAHLT